MNRFCPAVCLIASVAIFIVGCQKPAAPPKSVLITPVAPPAAEVNIPALQPKIIFENTSHDFGKVTTNSVVACEFKFKNTGQGLLKITDVHAPCGCTMPQLEKKEYQPGESGTITVKYRASNRPHADTKHVFVQTNEIANPKIDLILKAKVVNIIAFEPERLVLSLRQPNAGCRPIRLVSDDNQPFAIKEIESTGDCMIVDFNSATQATQYLLQPKVDVEKLRQTWLLEGNLTIKVTRPNCPPITIPFLAGTEFKVEPAVVSVLNAEPNKPVQKQLAIRSNFSQPFELQYVTSRMGFTKILQQRNDPNGGCIVELQITPPPKNNRTMFNDVLMVKIKNGEYFKVNCRGFYAK